MVPVYADSAGNDHPAPAADAGRFAAALIYDPTATEGRGTDWYPKLDYGHK